jgi:hypothetical protein
MRNTGILPDEAARAKAAASARRRGITTREARIVAGSEEAAGNDTRREDERMGRDEARVDKRAATAFIPLSLNIWCLRLRGASQVPGHDRPRVFEAEKVKLSCWKD